MTYRAGVVGAAGFAGIELVRILLRHPDFELVVATSDALAGTPLAKAYPAFAGVTDLAFSTHAEANFETCDVVFLAVPHTAAMGMAPALLEAGVTVIDLSADFRLKNPQVYEAWYAPHTAPDLLASAAFGLPEITGEELARVAEKHAQGEAVLVGCAGCYPTATSLAAYPFLKSGLAAEGALVVVDAISGITGAGKKATERTHFCFGNDNLEAYGVGTHRHTPEIEQILGIEGRLVFTPHLAPLNRGLLSTVTMQLSEEARAQGVTTQQLVDIYANYYAESPLVTVCAAGQQPRTASVAGTCRAQVGIAVHPSGAVVATGAIDNLGKGAAGQSVQCANIVFGLPELAGLTEIANPI